MAENQTDAARPRLRVAFVPGVTPDKWFRVWRERCPNAELVPLPLEDEREQESVLRDGEVDMALVRLPIDREGRHLIPLYEEQPVVVAPKGHVIEAADVVEIDELADEHLLQHPDSVPEWRDVSTEVAAGTRVDVPAMTPRQVIEVVATGAGIAIVPLSVARQFERKDVIRRPVGGVAASRVGLCWPDGDDDPLIEQFMGVVRGRSARSTRVSGAAEAEQREARKRAADKKVAARRATEENRARKRADRSAKRRGGARKRRGR